MGWKHRHLLGIQPLSREDIWYLLHKANFFRDSLEEKPKKEGQLNGFFMINLFFEPSTRTRISFEMAAKLLGMEVINFTTEMSSILKGENLRDTVRTLSRLKADVLVIRHSSSGVPQYLSQFLPFHIINAGDGMREHPTQALLDLLTIWRHFGRLSNLKVAIIGDILHSRVARSLTIGLQKMGSEVFFSGAPTLVPPEAEKMGGQIIYPLEKAIQGVDVIYLLRIQQERQKAGFFSSIKEYNHFFSLRKDLWEKAKGQAIIMHPGPVNRGVEVDSELVEGTGSLIEEQVTCGLAVRMAVLDTLIQEGKAGD
ncbi:MAG: aspartate carbamoyltransferase catalytic subunit [Candidatus Atribacteria bacterium]|nr:aspartate carbamoyltransferase catalytic subunit [Candidatus Atribacteria bacterium]